MLDPSCPRERIPGLDVLRGLAAAAVLAFHYTSRFGTIFGHPTAPWILLPWGQHGVEVFFVISGFAIELSLESSSTARDFLVSRALRLYPTFWAALAVTFTVVGVFGLPERAASPLDALLNLSMIPASLGAKVVDGVYWTLERELRFYGLILLLLVLGLRRYTVPALLITVAVQTVDAASPIVPHWISDLLNAHWAHLFACGSAPCPRPTRAVLEDARAVGPVPRLESRDRQRTLHFTAPAPWPSCGIATRPARRRARAPFDLPRADLLSPLSVAPVHRLRRDACALCSRSAAACGDRVGVRRRTRARNRATLPDREAVHGPSTTHAAQGSPHPARTSIAGVIFDMHGERGRRGSAQPHPRHGAPGVRRPAP